MDTAIANSIAYEIKDLADHAFWATNWGAEIDAQLQQYIDKPHDIAISTTSLGGTVIARDVTVSCADAATIKHLILTMD